MQLPTRNRNSISSFSHHQRRYLRPRGVKIAPMLVVLLSRAQLQGNVDHLLFCSYGLASGVPSNAGNHEWGTYLLSCSTFHSSRTKFHIWLLCSFPCRARTYQLNLSQIVGNKPSKVSTFAEPTMGHRDRNGPGEKVNPSSAAYW